METANNRGEQGIIPGNASPVEQASLRPPAMNWRRRVQALLTQLTRVPGILRGPCAHPFIGYGAAILMQGLIVPVMLTTHAGGFRLSGTTSLLIVLLVALFWGSGPGLLATLFGIVFSLVLSAFVLTTTRPEDVFGMVLLLLVGGIISALAAQTMRTHLQAGSIGTYGDLSTLFQQVPAEILLLHGPDYRIVQANMPSWHTGEPRVLVGETVKEAFPAYITPDVLQQLDHVYQTGVPYTLVELPVRREQEGTVQERYFTVTVLPVRTPGGLIDGLTIFSVDVTDQVQARQHAEALLMQRDAMLEAMTDGVFVYDREGHIILFNGAMQDLLGVSQAAGYHGLAPEERATRIQLRDIHGQLLPVDTWPSTRILQGEIFRGADALDIQVQGIDGRTTMVSVSGAPLRDAQGAIDGAVLVLRDITERQRLEQELREQAQLLETTFEAMVDAVVIYDRDGRLLRTNRKARELFALDLRPGHEIMPLVERVAPFYARDVEGETIPQEMWPQRRVLNGEVLTGNRNNDLMLRMLDGREVLTSVSGGPLRDAHGQIAGAVLIVRDVTQRREVERALRRSEQQLRLVIDGIPSFVVYVDRNYCYQFVNRALAEGIGRSREEVVGKSVAQVYGEQGFQELLPYFERTFAGEEIHFERSYPRLDGTIGILSLLYLPDKDEAGYVRGCIGVLTDITEQRRQEEIMRTNELAAVETARLLDEFIGVAGHELRTPLTTIKASVQLSKRQLTRLSNQETGTLEEIAPVLRTVLGLLNRTERQINMQNRLVSDLLDVSRIRSDRLELHPELFDLIALVRETLEDQRELTPARQLTLSVEVTDDALVLADADRVRQVLTNYLSNALKYSAADQPVEVEVQIIGTKIRVAVIDHGPGLPEQHQQHIWERFYRVPGVEVRSGSGVGLGLGLHISRMLIERQDGMVGVQSEPGKGSTFWFTLPLAEFPVLADSSQSVLI